MAYEQELAGIANEVWSTFIGAPLDPPTDKKRPIEVVAFVQLTGAFEGTVSLSCTEGIARQAASAMFGLEAAEVGDQELADAMGEVANVLGGRVKPLLDSAAKLSLPAVVRGHDFRLTVPGSTVITEVYFGWSNEPLHFEILRRETNGH